MNDPVEACPALEPRKHDRPGRERALVDAATVVFAECGFDAATTREVAARAGCAEGLIHRYFGGKRGLLKAVFEERASRVLEGLSELPLAPDLAADIEAVLAWSLDSAWAARDAIRVTLSQSIINPDLGEAAGHLFTESRARAIGVRLAAHSAAGRIAPGADLQSAAMAIEGLCFFIALVQQIVVGTGRDELREEIAAVARVMARGLAPATVV